MNLASPTAAAKPALVTAPIERLPKGLPKVDFVPKGTTDHGAPDQWFDWNLATVTSPDGFDPRTGKPVFDKERVVLAPYDEFKSAVKLDAKTPFKQVVAIAQARAGFDRENAIGGPQAILQAKDGAWFIAMAGYWDGPDHIEPINLDFYAKGSTVRQHVRDLKAIVDRETWVDFTDAPE
jgi:hypothetical protein